MNNEIKIPWYHKQVKRVNNLTLQPVIIDFPDGKKKQTRKPNKPQPRPQPQLQPEPIRAIEEIYNPDGTKETIFIDTPIPVIIPSRNGESKPLPTFDGKDKNNPTIPVPNWRERIPTRSPNPTQGLSPAIKMPAGEVLFKLMEAEPSGKYNNFLQDYNNISLELFWNVANPFIIFSEPTYSQVEEFFKTHNYEEITKDDILKYFKNEGISGKNLTSLPVRIFAFKSTIDTLNALEHIIIPPLPSNEPKQY